MFKEIKRIYSAFFYSIDGLKYAIKHEKPIITELILLFILSPIGFYLSDNWVELVLLVGSVITLLIVEVINSALEKTVDRISKDLHPLSKIIKDLGSLAVFLSFILMVFIWSAKIITIL